MRTTHARRLRLNQLTRDFEISDREVAALVGRTADYVREWRLGKHPISESMLRLLELELEHGRGRPLAQRVEDPTAAQG